jgi:hypothetical protein
VNKSKGVVLAGISGLSGSECGDAVFVIDSENGHFHSPLKSALGGHEHELIGSFRP